MDNKDYYALLGIGRQASQQHIKEAYRRKAFEFHPDRNHDNPDCASMMKAVNEAYAVLSDPSKRRQYDTLRNTYGDTAHRHFRQSYSEKDIYSNSDIQQIFEEMARAFGLRGFDEIFKDLHGAGAHTFRFGHLAGHGRGFVFQAKSSEKDSISKRAPFAGTMQKIAGKLIGKTLGIQIPRNGADWTERITLSPELASKGGPFAFYHRRRNKKLVVHIPAGVKTGQHVRLSGMGERGDGGAPDGDLYLTIRIKQSIGRWLKSLRF